MEGGGDSKGSIAGASDEQDAATDARADGPPPRTEMGDSWVVCMFPTSAFHQVVDLLHALSIRPIDIPVLRLSPIEEEDNSKDLFWPVVADEMKAASALTMMKHQVPVLQPQTQQRQMEQNPRQVEMEQSPMQVELFALDKDHHHHSNAAGAIPRRLRIPRRPRSKWVGWSRKRSGLRLKKYVLRLRSQGIL